MSKIITILTDKGKKTGLGNFVRSKELYYNLKQNKKKIATRFSIHSQWSRFKY